MNDDAKLATADLLDAGAEDNDDQELLIDFGKAAGNPPARLQSRESWR